MENSIYRYQIQVGLFRDYNNALNFQMQLLAQDYPVEILRQGEYYAVRIGNYDALDKAVVLERYLRTAGFNTLLVAV